MKKLENFVSVIAVVLLLSISVSSVSNILIRKNSISHYSQFYDNNEPYDILFLGTSHTLRGVSPLELWDDFGYTSYNMSMSGCRMATSYWILKNALSHCRPKLVVVECTYLYLSDKLHQNVAYSHTFFDYLPTGLLKLQTAADLYGNWKDIFQEAIFPLARYHNRWTELSKEDFDVKIESHMGVQLKTDNAVPVNYPLLMSQTPTPVDNPSSEYLNKLIEMCQDQGIEVLLVFMPFDEEEASQNDAAYTKVVADSYGINYLDPYMIAECLNEKTDYNDSTSDNSHLNLSGALRYTNYLGSYISQNYEVPDHRSEPDVAERWDSYYNQYCADKTSHVKNQKQLNLLLMNLADDDYDILIDLTSDSVLYDKTYKDFFENLGIEPEKVTGDHTIISLRYGDYCSYSTLEDSSPTSIGHVCVNPFTESSITGYQLLIDEQEVYRNNDSGSDSLAILVFSHETGELIRVFENK